jgi:hypothetical protein
MKKITISLLLISFLAFLSFPMIVLGDIDDTIKAAPDIKPMGALDRVINVLFTVLLLFAALMIIIAGYQFVTAGGDATKVAEARNKVMWALVGIAVAFLARGLVGFVEKWIQ